MTSLQRVEQHLKKTASGTLADLLKDRVRQRTTFLLLDVSGSMDAPIGPGHRKIDALRRIVDDLHGDLHGPLVAFGLCTAPRQVAYVDRVPEPSGTTPLKEGIVFCHEEGAQRIIVVSDGAPDDAGGALEAARAFKHPIDVFFVGSDGETCGAAFLRSLCVAAGGQYDDTPLTAPKELATKIRGLLNA